MVFVPVQAAERLPKVVFGEIDLECGSTTATAERGKAVGFSPIFFLAGTKLLVPAAGGDKPAISSYRDLAGRNVAVSTGTTNLTVMQRLAGNLTPPMTIKEVPSTDAGYDALASGAADAFASDDVLLYGLAASRPDGKRFRVVGDFLSYEPYAILLRRDDPGFSEVVRASFARMAEANMLGPSYNRWFMEKLPTGEDMNLPISPQLAEMYRALGQPD
jgi:glutamate/aspartate transport system substrate-binding protein